VHHTTATITNNNPPIVGYKHHTQHQGDAAVLEVEIQVGTTTTAMTHLPSARECDATSDEMTRRSKEKRCGRILISMAAPMC
jgi:hypothetical protein